MVLWRISSCINKVVKFKDKNAEVHKLNSLILCPSTFARFLSSKNKTPKIELVMNK